MMSGTAASIIIPVYNMADTLDKAIYSALRQTLKSIEVIIVNDGSTDSSADCAARFLKGGAEYDRRIHYAMIRHQGKLAACNRGIEIAQGEFVTILDADDTLPDTSVQTRAHVLRNNPAAVAVFGDAQYMDACGNPYRIRRSRPTSSIQDLLSQLRAPVVGPSLMFRKSSLEKTVPFDTSFARSADKHIACELLRAGKILYTIEIVYNYRTRRRPGTVTSRIRQWYDLCRIIARYCSFPENVTLTVRQTFFHLAKLIYECFFWKK
ncbi:MAG: glycosyltransferase [Chitinivibrionales bacterium]|nr:glycosyltransferase [Chitinivibrionales bacterium]